jgi:hypothetical protein
VPRFPLRPAPPCGALRWELLREGSVRPSVTVVAERIVSICGRIVSACERIVFVCAQMSTWEQALRTNPGLSPSKLGEPLAPSRTPGG